MKVEFTRLQEEFKRVLLNNGFQDSKAELCASIFAENSRDGVHTHGLNRFPSFVRAVKEGLVKPDAEPERMERVSALENWDGNLAPGISNAIHCMNRAIELAGEYGVGCVSLKNTNHWMRGGTYGWQAADAGFIGICFTNTIANVTPWGGTEPRLGNNPIVIAVPRPGGHIVLDMAVSQYSFGKMQEYKFREEHLPFPGGFDSEGKLSKEPSKIIESQRALPIGYWKGSGLSLLVDVLLTSLSGGRSTADITRGGAESGVSQCFIAIKPGIGNEALVEKILEFTKFGHPGEVRYPGESTLSKRIQHTRDGIPVNEKIWNEVLSM